MILFFRLQKAFLFCIGFLFANTVNSQRFEVWSSLKPMMGSRCENCFFKVRVPTDQFNMWLVEEVEQKRIRLFLDENFTRPLPAEEFYTLFFPALFSEEYHYSRPIWDELGIGTHYAEAAIPAAARWRTELGKTGSLHKAIQNCPEFLTEALSLTHFQNYRFKETWQMKRNSLLIKPKLFSIVIVNTSVPYDTLSVLFASLSPAQLPAEQFAMSNPYSIFQPASNRQVLELNLWMREPEAYRRQGEEEWKMPDEAAPLDSLLILNWVQNRSKLRMKEDEIFSAELGCATKTHGLSFSSTCLEGHTYKDTTEFDILKELSSEVLWPLLQEAFRGRLPALNSNEIARAQKGTVPLIDPFQHWLAVNGLLNEEEKINFDEYLRDQYPDAPLFDNEIPPEFKSCLNWFQLYGSFSREGDSVVFLPRYLTFVWTDPTETLPARSLFTLDLDTVQATFHSMSLKTFFGEMKYPSTLIAINHYFFRNKYCSVFLKRQIFSSNWNKLPDEDEMLKFDQMDEESWMQWFKEMNDNGGFE